MFDKYIGHLIKYKNHFWLLDNIKSGEAELWYNGTCEIVPIDDLNENDVVIVNENK